MQIIQACELSKPILRYIFINDQELCPGHPGKLSGRCELVRVKLSRLYCSFPVIHNMGFPVLLLDRLAYDTVRGMSRLLGNAMSALVLVFALA